MPKCKWCGRIIDRDYRGYINDDFSVGNFCGPKCYGEMESQNNVDRAQFAAGAAAVIVVLVYLAVGMVKLIRWVAPHVARESLISLRHLQIKKLKSLDLHTAQSELGKKIYSGNEKSFEISDQKLFAQIDCLLKELSDLSSKDKTSTIRDNAVAKGKSVIVKRKLSIAYGELGQAAYDSNTKSLLIAFPEQTQKVESIRQQISGLQNEIESLMAKRN